MTPNKPVRVFVCGNIRASVWTAPHESVHLQKRYFDDKQQQWRNSEYLFPDELPRARLVLEKAYEFLCLREEDPGSTRPNQRSS